MPAAEVSGQFRSSSEGVPPHQALRAPARGDGLGGDQSRDNGLLCLTVDQTAVSCGCSGLLLVVRLPVSMAVCCQPASEGEGWSPGICETGVHVSYGNGQDLLSFPRALQYLFVICY